MCRGANPSLEHEIWAQGAILCLSTSTRALELAVPNLRRRFSKEARAGAKHYGGSYSRLSKGVTVFRPLLLFLVFAAIRDLSGQLFGNGRGSLVQGAAAQNVTCPDNAGPRLSWPGEEGLGQPLITCRCKEGYFDTSTEFFRLMLVEELAIQIFECTPTYQCPRKCGKGCRVRACVSVPCRKDARHIRRQIEPFSHFLVRSCSGLLLSGHTGAQTVPTAHGLHTRSLQSRSLSVH